MKNKGITLGLILLMTMPVLASKSYEVAHGEVVIVKVYDSAVGIQSHSISDGKECRIVSTLSPARELSAELGKTVKFHVVDGKDIIVLCNGKKGIAISRD